MQEVEDGDGHLLAEGVRELVDDVGAGRVVVHENGRRPFEHPVGFKLNAQGSRDGQRSTLAPSGSIIGPMRSRGEGLRP